ncbi:MAG TPA: type 4a pilus biogenesis protein PilO [Armatimonadota bacterium]|jgi:Tfp pilus assembly protein PilO
MASKRRRLDKKTLIVIGAVLGAEIIVCGGAVMGIHTRKTGMEQTLSGKESALTSVRTVSASMPALRLEYTRMQAQVRFLESSLPPAEYVPTLLGQVEHAANQCGVTIAEFRPKPAPPTPPGATANSAPGGATQQVFDMSVHGKYNQVQKFLATLTQFRKILALTSVKLQPASNGGVGDSPALTGNLTFTAYLMPSTASAAPAPSAATSRATAAAPAPGQQVAVAPASPRG